jgi:acetyl-CoA carboxylase carboxyltransferase component
MNIRKELDELNQAKERLSLGGGKSAIDRQHSAGKLTAWERMRLLFDAGTFRELDLLVKPFKTGFEIDQRELPRDGILTGYGMIDGRTVYAALCDFTVASGSQGSMQIMKLAKAIEQARKEGFPFVYVVDSAGRRLQDRIGKFGHRSPIRVDGCGEGNVDMFSMPMASGVIPLISIALGPGYAGTAYCPSMSDFLIFRRGTSSMSISSPMLIKSVTGTEVSQEEIGGAMLHATTTGLADILVDSDEEAFAKCRELLGYLPSNWNEKPQVSKTKDDPQRGEEELLDLIPTDSSSALDMSRLVSLVVDEAKFFEIAPLYARNMITGFARLAGQVVGIVANNSLVADGSLNANGCDKQARFIRTCDSFNIPLIFLVDTPGFSSSKEQEQSPEGIARHAAKSVYAMCEATVPKIIVYVRRCFGAARLVMGGRGMQVDSVLAWSSAQFNYGNYVVQEPYNSAGIMAVEEIIDPRATRLSLIERLQRLAHKLDEPKPWRKHDLIPM